MPGLRREELAQLAGVSVDYYTRVEQGRSPSVSDAVLDAIARVLRLTEDERGHLRRLVRPVRGPKGRQTVRKEVARLLEMMGDVPAFVIGRRMDVLALNPLGAAVTGFSADTSPNAARYTFLDPTARDFCPEWQAVAEETVASLRLDAGRHPDDPKLAALVGELSMRSEEFRTLWARQDVRQKTHGRKLIRHPLVGDLDLRYETLRLTGDDDQLLITYTAEAGSPTADALRQLAGWSLVEVAGGQVLEGP